MSKDLDKILSARDKGLSEAAGPLARLYRQILLDHNIDWYKMNNLLNRYVEDPRNRVANDRKTRSSERGNMIKEIARPDMTFKVFFKGIRLLAPVRARFEVHLEWGSKKKTITGFHIPLNMDEEQQGDN